MLFVFAGSSCSYHLRLCQLNEQSREESINQFLLNQPTNQQTNKPIKAPPQTIRRQTTASLPACHPHAYISIPIHLHIKSLEQDCVASNQPAWPKLQSGSAKPCPRKAPFYFRHGATSHSPLCGLCMHCSASLGWCSFSFLGTTA